MFLSRSQRHRWCRRSLSFASPFSSFSKESVTTKVSPIVKHGPFGSGGTVVGFSKHDGVRAAFEENFARRLELGSQLVVYEKGEKIIDLYGYAPETETQKNNNGVGYDGDTLQCVFSSGKNMEAIAMAMLVDRGLVDYDDLVTKHWPEFGANGKDTITIADVMRHSGGVPFIIDPDSKNDTITITPEDVFGVDSLEQKICAAERFPPSSSPELCYHAHTRGWIVNGILRRTDPSGRSLARFIKDEITDPLSKVGDTGEVTFFCGIPKEDQLNQKFADINKGSDLYNGMAQVLPGLVGFGEKSTAEFAKLFLRKDVRRKVISWIDTPPSFDYIDSPEGRSMEYSSAGMVANARSMAIINAAAMAGDGSFNGVRLLSPEGVSHSMGDIVTRIDAVTDLSVGISRGGYGNFKESFGEGRVGSYHTRVFHPDDKIAYGNCMGWGGIGGSLSIVDRQRDISFAYCMNAFGLSLIGGVRTRRILLELQKAVAE
jgi:CubicO group peptidase (beta-lactamase class C family)